MSNDEYDALEKAIEKIDSRSFKNMRSLIEKLNNIDDKITKTETTLKAITDIPQETKDSYLEKLKSQRTKIIDTLKKIQFSDKL
jgi:uncharacterized protein YdcH (DUF465 family)